MKNINSDYEKMNELYDQYEQKVYYVAYSILGNVQQSEDVTQETFISLYQHLHKASRLNTQDLKRYIMKIAKNKAIDSYRRNKRQETLLNKYQNEASEVVDENIEDWEQQLMSEDTIDELLATIAESSKQVFKYKVFYNLPYSEISKVMGITEANARKQFERTRKQILKLIGGCQDGKFERHSRNG